MLACLEGLYHKYQLLPQTYFTVLCIEVLYGITSSAKSAHPYLFFFFFLFSSLLQRPLASALAGVVFLLKIFIFT